MRQCVQHDTPTCTGELNEKGFPISSHSRENIKLFFAFFFTSNFVLICHPLGPWGDGLGRRRRGRRKKLKVGPSIRFLKFITLFIISQHFLLGLLLHTTTDRKFCRDTAVDYNRKRQCLYGFTSKRNVTFPMASTCFSCFATVICQTEQYLLIRIVSFYDNNQ